MVISAWPKLIAIILLLAALGSAALGLSGGLSSPTPAAAQTPTTDYDANNNGLIEIRSLAQLDAIRHDLDGNGDATHADYVAAFDNRDTNAASRMGCPNGACTGYELMADLAFANTTTSNWDPIGNFSATLDGNGHTITGLYVDTTGNAGLFRELSASARIRNLGLIEPWVQVNSLGGQLGALVGHANAGSVIDSVYVQDGAIVIGNGLSQAGGLAGKTLGTIHASYATNVDLRTTDPCNGCNSLKLGGLVGQMDAPAAVIASYAAATNTVLLTSGSHIGGLVGSAEAVDADVPVITDSYCDTDVGPNDCLAASTGVTLTVDGKTTAQLQAPTGYTGPYEHWNLDLDANDVPDYLWNFGAAGQYPKLNTPAQRAALIPAPADYDANDNGLIDVASLNQLHALRWDLDGNGAPTAAAANAYRTAFPGGDTTPANRMGCPEGACAGYELTQNLTFPAETGSPYTPWTPIGGRLNTTFDGNGYTLSNLRISLTAGTNVALGLFRYLGGSGYIRDVGLINPAVTSTRIDNTDLGDIGALVGRVDRGGRIDNSYVLGGRIHTDGEDANQGGLVGYNLGRIRASYSTAEVTADGARENIYSGGLVGYLFAGSITASYAAGPLPGNPNAANNTYFAALAGYVSNSGSISDSYCDNQTSMRTQANCVGGTYLAGTIDATATTTANLQTPTDYTGIYAEWNLDLDNNLWPDHPWDFGTASQYPKLNTPAQRAALTPALIDYDANNNGLIDIASIAQLDAVRYDLDGDGVPASTTPYEAAYPNRHRATSTRMGCPAGACTGYELAADLTFPTSGDYANWTPIGGSDGFIATFDGGGHTLTGLNVSATGVAALFVRIGDSVGTATGTVKNLGLINPAITTSGSGGENQGALAATIGSRGLVENSYVRGGTITVSGASNRGGGLAGQNNGLIRASYSTASVVATGDPAGLRLGGLVGLGVTGQIVASYAAGVVTPGTNANSIANSGGLVGRSTGANDTITNSYCDLGVSTRSDCVGTTADSSAAAAAGHTTAELQTPTDYTGIYVDWNLDPDGDFIANNPWYFGGATDYPRTWPERPAGAPADYDANNNNLIDITNVAQLYAMRADPDGDGRPATGTANAYQLGYPDPANGAMGCPGDCAGYELRANLTLPATTTGAYNPWAPPVAPLTTVFDGNGHTIAGLNIVGSIDAGLFGTVGAPGVIRDVGLISPSVTAQIPVRFAGPVGALAARNNGRIDSSYVQGGSVTYEITATGAIAGAPAAGGLVGNNRGLIRASYAAAVAVSNTGTTPTLAAKIGGLVGEHSSGEIIASYAAPGELAGFSTLTPNIGGLIGEITGTVRGIVNSYCDTTTTTDCAGAVPLTTWPPYTDPGQTSAQLQTPTGYTGIYQNWNLDLDGDHNLDYPWNFGATTSYPALNTPTQRANAVPPRRDYDRNNNNLIEISSLAQLDAIRYDPDGDGNPQTENAAAYGTAFAGRAAGLDGRMGCPVRCLGYELTQDLAFDTSTPANWTPIPEYNAMLEGNSHTITGANIVVAAAGRNAGFIERLQFAGTSTPLGIDPNLAGGRTEPAIRNLGLVDFNVTSTVANTDNGILVGYAGPRTVITGAYSRGGRISIATSNTRAGGLVGQLQGTIRASYSRAAVHAPDGLSNLYVGGLVGRVDDGDIIASYAAGPVTGPATTNVGGLAGAVSGRGGRITVTDSYCDSEATTQSNCFGFIDNGTSIALTTATMQGTTGYTGFYENWNLDLDGDGRPDNPWNFGTAEDYPEPGATSLDSPPPGGPRFASPPQDTPYNPALDHPEIYQNDRHEMTATCDVQYNAEGQPETSQITFNLGTYQGQVILHLAQWNGEYFTSYESLGIDMPPFQRDGQTATVRVTTNPANTRFLLDSVSPTTNLVLGYADCHTDDATGTAAAAADSDAATSTATAAGETADTSTPAAPKVYTNDRYEMTASCAVTNDAEGIPTSSRITFNLGNYTGQVILSISLWNGEYYASLDSHGLDAPLLERDGQAATVQVTTNPAETRFLLDGTPNGLRTNLLLGYADCHTAGE